MNSVEAALGDSHQKMVVTGFGPFQGFPINPSGVIADALDGTSAFGLDLAGGTLETSWQRAWPALRTLVDEHRPIGLVMMGAAPDSFFRFEVRAHNAFWAEHDIDGVCPRASNSSSLVSGAPWTYGTTLPIAELRTVLRFGSPGTPSSSCSFLFPRPKPGFGVRTSSDAGRFICNQVYYLALHQLRELVPYIGFIHVPSLASHDPERRGKLVRFSRYLIERIALTLLLKELGLFRPAVAEVRQEGVAT